MRILRIRRGFTTNSSSANEYVPIDGGLPAPRTAASASSSASARAIAATSASAARPTAGADAGSVDAGLSGARANAGAAGATGSDGATPAARTYASDGAGCSTFDLLSLFAAVVGLFIADRVVRTVRRGQKASGGRKGSAP